MVSFDANALSILIFKSSAIPLDFRTQPPTPIRHARERMEHLVTELSQKGEKILIPDPSLSEFLVTVVFAGASIQEYLRIIQGAQYFITRPFGVRAAVETAERLASAIKAGDKREGEKAEPWQKLKYDRQIVAISVVEGATAIYSTDRDVHNQATRWGVITPVSPADLPVPPKQHPLPLPPAQPAPQTGKPSEPTNAEQPKKP
jgi:predicted nucleic acid-binding protein